MENGMNNTSLTIKVPGKLMIAGEYAVLTSAYPAIVAAVDRYITINIKQANSFKISDNNSKIPELTWSFDQHGAIIGLEGQEHSFMKEAITIACQYLKEKSIRISPFHLQIKNGLNDKVTGWKYGLGSSAAIVVGVISAILALHGEKIDDEYLKLYKLSCIAHLKTQGNGSGADIAASVYGGWLCYYRYDVDWLIPKLYAQDQSILNLITIPWPGLRIEGIVPPLNIKLMAGWTKHSAKTSPLVDKIEAFQRRNAKEYQVFLDQSKVAVEEFIRACQLGHEAGILQAIQKNRMALQYLSSITGEQLETKEIKDLCQLANKYGSGKFSGAGGGDCGIALLTNGQEIEALKEEWLQAGIIPLDINIAKQGVMRV